MGDREEKYRYKFEKRRLKEDRKALKRRGAVIGARVTGSIWVGLIVVLIGSCLLAREFGAWFPNWLFSWPMLLICFSLLIGAKNGFRDFGWLIVCAVGTLFLLDRMYPEVPIHRFIWPVAIIGVGLMIALSSRSRHRSWHDHNDPEREQNPADPNIISGSDPANTTFTTNTTNTGTGTGPSTSSTTGDPSKNYKGEDFIDAVAVFGGIDKMVFSKTFKGGEIVCIFGGGEINLSQADFEKVATVNVTAIFGGLKLTVPPNWSVRSELNPVFGGIDDKRSHTAVPDPDKVLILKGTVIFGGVDIRSF
jgi:hypothetical protein